ncbi:MAG: Dam family site-specific DNA-(adenine-N6)-methyltransferase [Akkermansiaceae bacterium]|nr:Dam family site-specific DNA-(adenine-N6)-methyltransferase [Akkermansiaceae bacterium]
MKKRALKPIVKWAGGKSQLIEEISSRYPNGLGVTIKKYAEPFVGGGAILLDILAHYDLDEIYISDINAELINMYSKVKTDVDNVIKLLHSYQEQYIPMNNTARKDFFYARRNEFNSLIINENSKNSLNSAALFIFLNRTCFNGLYRVNRKGLYNVPMGAYKNPLICDERNLRAVSAALQKVTIVCADYRASAEFVDENTLVYFDPPYRPLSVTSNFTSYTENVFDDAAQAELAAYAEQLMAKGAFVMLSNSDPKNSNPEDDFFDKLYSRLHIDRIFASRMINSNADARGKISELFICNYERRIL